MEREEKKRQEERGTHGSGDEVRNVILVDETGQQISSPYPQTQLHLQRQLHHSDQDEK